MTRENESIKQLSIFMEFSMILEDINLHKESADFDRIAFSAEKTPFSESQYLEMLEAGIVMVRQAVERHVRAER